MNENENLKNPEIYENNEFTNQLYENINYIEKELLNDLSWGSSL